MTIPILDIPLYDLRIHFLIYTWKLCDPEQKAAIRNSRQLSALGLARYTIR